MAMNRRQFLKVTGLAGAGTALASTVGPRHLLRQAMATGAGERYVVICFLDGGNDGLNTIVPVSNGTSGTLRDAYEWARGTGSGGLRLSDTELAPTQFATDGNTQTPLAFHPAMTEMKALFDAGHVAVIQGCGYPYPNLSHEESSQHWETANPLKANGFRDGWMGRYLASQFGPSDLEAVSIGGTVPGEFRQTTTGVLSFYELEYFGFPRDYWFPTEEPYWQPFNSALDTAFNALQQSAQGTPDTTHSLIGATGESVFSAAQAYPVLHTDYVNDRPAFDSSYDVNPSNLKHQLREVAKVIYGDINDKVSTRHFQVDIGGFDTHGDQGGNGGFHGSLLADVSESISTFYADCDDMGVADQVLIVLWSEFGRRVRQNANGTDHGSQGPMFVIGGCVNGGLYGNHPDINPGSLSDHGNTRYSQDNGNPYRSTDFRDVYGTIFSKWLNVADPTTLLPVDTGPANDEWTVPDFAMGFLP